MGAVCVALSRPWRAWTNVLVYRASTNSRLEEISDLRGLMKALSPVLMRKTRDKLEARAASAGIDAMCQSNQPAHQWKGT